MNAALSLAKAGSLHQEIMKRNPSRLQEFVDRLFKEFESVASDFLHTSSSEQRMETISDVKRKRNF